MKAEEFPGATDACSQTFPAITCNREHQFKVLSDKRADSSSYQCYGREGIAQDHILSFEPDSIYFQTMYDALEGLTICCTNILDYSVNINDIFFSNINWYFYYYPFLSFPLMLNSLEGLVLTLFMDATTIGLERDIFQDSLNFLVDGFQIRYPVFYESALIDSLNDNMTKAEITSTGYSLSNYPNPFNPATRINYSLPPHITDAVLHIYNLKGEIIRHYQINGNDLRSILWNGTDKDGKEVGAGIYLCELKVAENRLINKMIFLK